MLASILSQHYNRREDGPYKIFIVISIVLVFFMWDVWHIKSHFLTIRSPTPRTMSFNALQFDSGVPDLISSPVWMEVASNGTFPKTSCSKHLFRLFSLSDLFLTPLDVFRRGRWNKSNNKKKKLWHITRQDCGFRGYEIKMNFQLYWIERAWRLCKNYYIKQTTIHPLIGC